MKIATTTTAFLEKFMLRTRRAFAVGVGLALAVLAVTIVAGSLFVRSLVRQQIAQRDAEALYATTLMEQLNAAGENGIEFRDDEQIGFDAAVLASRLRGVMGIRLYDLNGQFKDSFPVNIMPQPLGHAPLSAVRAGKPHSKFSPDMPLSDVFIYMPQFATGQVARVPILQVTVPLHGRDPQKLIGAAQFIVEGHSIAREYAHLDQHLTQIGVLTFLVAGGLLVSLLWLALRHVEKLNSELAHRSERLLRANEELALAARAAALGAVSAHLMHGLKNPLASLSQFVTERTSANTPLNDADWQDALTAARRMQSLVEQTLEVLANARGRPTYEVTIRELVDDVRRRVEPLAVKRAVELLTKVDVEQLLSSHKANLASLILVNLVENAIEATPAGKTVTLGAVIQGDGLVFRVRDEGPGFPEHLRKQLFLPCKSTKEAGSGLGLAISKKIADYLGARLELETTSPEGCVFALNLPMLSAAGQPTQANA